MAVVSSERSPAPRKMSDELAQVLPSGLLLLLMTGSVVWALSVSSWAVGLEVLRPMALLGLLVGLIFARLPRLSAWVAHALSAALALTWAVQLLGAQMDPRLLTWRDQAADMLIRVIIWLRVLGSGGRGEDILLFVLALCLLVWALAYGTAWMVLRHGWTWRPIMLSAVVALVNYTYVLPKPTVAFFVFLCAALLLLVYQHVLAQQATWQAQRVQYPELLALRFLWSASVVCGLLIALTAILPGQVSIDRATRTWTMLSSPFKAARERWEDMFSTISAPPGTGSGAFTSRVATLGGGRQLTTDLVMEVRSTAYDYWRAVAFDKYTGQGWQNTIGEQARATLGVSTPEQARTPREAEQPIPSSDIRARREIAQRYTLASDRLDDLVLVGGTASRVSLPTLIEHNYLTGAEGHQPNFDETALVVARERLSAGQTYTVTALVSFADVTGLRAAGTTYPPWVRERYLQLPDSVTARTREQAALVLAQAGAATPYDAAITIQTYLRRFPYNERIPAPPAGADDVDWFLFDQREGYCDYFASAMVVMLRSQGIPARWVRGYAGGDFDAQRGVYVVHENMAHSWPEVYFPGYGWERFEPTAASYTTPPVRPLSASFGSESDPAAGSTGANVPLPQRQDELDEGVIQRPVPVVLPNSSARQSSISPSLRMFGSLFGLVLLVAAAIYGRWRYELRGLSQARAQYAGMALLARWGGLAQAAHHTPHEHAAALVAALPAQQRTIKKIVAAYVREQYGASDRAPGRLYDEERRNLPSADEARELHLALVRRILTRHFVWLPKLGRS